jgi:predicted transposase/invertase (TIGR01784 family)
MKARYVNPFTDFGFKKLFGEEASKPQLIDFLNALLPLSSPIRGLAFRDREMLGMAVYDRRVIYDIHCESENGDRFIVEMQKAKQNFFKDRSVFYATFPIREQAEQGSWNFRLSAVYCVGILDFAFEDTVSDDDTPDVVHTLQLKNQRNQVFYDKLTFVYLEMPNFRKEEEELGGRLDQWLYFLKKLETFEEIPRIFGEEPVFASALSRARLAVLTPQERDAYEESLKVYRDLNNVIETARLEGREEGREEGEQIGIEKGRRLALEAALARMMEEGLSESDARRLLGLQ